MFKKEIFISYKKSGAIADWIKNILYPILSKHIADIAGHGKVFLDTVDEEKQFGITTSSFLNDGIFSSRLLVPVITPPYFINSEWCRREFAYMLKRQKETGAVIIFPIVQTVDEQRKTTNLDVFCPLFSDYLKNNHRPLFLPRKYMVESLQSSSGAYLELVDILKEWVDLNLVPQMVRPQNILPTWNSEQWQSEAYNDLFGMIQTMCQIPIEQPKM